MERRIQGALYLVQISLLLIIAGCGGKREAQPPPQPQKEEKLTVSLEKAHFLETDSQGRKLLEIWANASKGEEERIMLQGVKSTLYEKGKPFAELTAPSAIYEPKKGFLILDKGGNLKEIKRKSDISCDYIEVSFKEKKIKGRDVSLKWGELSIEGREFTADWGLKRGMLNNGAVVKIELKRRQKR